MVAGEPAMLARPHRLGGRDGFRRRSGSREPRRPCGSPCRRV